MAGTSAPSIPHCRDLTHVADRLASGLLAAYSDRLGRHVTVTVYPRVADEATRDRFDRAATAARRLGAHPNVLTMHAWGHLPDGRPWVVTDPEPAETAHRLLGSRGPVGAERALQIGVLVAGALETAHRAGIVHGDLSPARLVFGPQGEPLVVEIGLAEFGNFPGFGALHNPIRYHAPPEVLERTALAPASDVYSLASTVYALLAGRAPHEKPADVTDSNASLLLRILQIDVPPIVRPDLPPELEEALRPALAHAPARRPQRVLQLARALQEVQANAGWAVTEPVVLDLDRPAESAGAGTLADDSPPAIPATGRPADASPGAGRRAVLAGGAPVADPSPGDPAAAPGLATGAPVPVPPAASPDLDTRPSWYTDPLPNGGPTISEADLVYLFSDTPPDLAVGAPGSSPWADPFRPSGANGHERYARAGDPGLRSTGREGQPGEGGPARLRTNGRSGHDGHHGRDDGGSVAPAHRPANPPDLPARGLDADLGPVMRPPVDLTRLGQPLGPTPPPLPRRPGGDLADVPRAAEPGGPPAAPLDRHDDDPPARLPRRHEAVQARRSGPAPTGPRDGRPARHLAPPDPQQAPTTATPAAGEPRTGLALERARATRELHRRNRARSVDPDPQQRAAEPARPRPAATAPIGPLALPVIVLIAVVVALSLGVAYMVVSDDSAEPPGAQPGPGVPAGSDAPAATPTNLTATETAAGVELAWDGSAGASYVVRVLSPSEAPVMLPPTGGTTMVVPASALDAASGYCFDVLPVRVDPGSDAPATVSTPPRSACIRGATSASVRTA